MYFQPGSMGGADNEANLAHRSSAMGITLIPFSVVIHRNGQVPWCGNYDDNVAPES